MVSELDVASLVCLREGAGSWGPREQHLGGARGPSRACREYEPLRPVSAPIHMLVNMVPKVPAGLGALSRKLTAVDSGPGIKV